jgi:16S rRNA (uracil1498-N3)-methyltransferase
MHLFFSSDADKVVFCLSPEESKHCLKVMRFRRGDSIYITNGKGLIIEGMVLDENPAGVGVRNERIFRNAEVLDFQLHVALSPLKNPSRFEWFVEKATELKVSRITPLICERTEKKTIRTDRLQKIAMEATKQSLSGFLPQIDDAVPFKEFVETSAHNAGKYIAVCHNNDRMAFQNVSEKIVICLIGPEGDFSFDEESFAVKSGYLPISLGEARLRSETAAILAVSAMFLKHQNI